MATKLNVITGATGLLGSHIAEQLTQTREPIRVLVRPTSDTKFLQSLGADIVAGNLADPEFITQGVRGAASVYHCASRVGDFGTWKTFQGEVVELTRNVVTACRKESVERVLHVSSVAVYGHRPRIPVGGLTEDEPFPRGWRF